MSVHRLSHARSRELHDLSVLEVRARYTTISSRASRSLLVACSGRAPLG
jgi:hypothetical protein